MDEIKIEKNKLDAMLAEVTHELLAMAEKDAQLAKAADDDAPAEESEGSEGPASPDSDGDDDGDKAPPAPEASAPAAEASAPPAPEASAPAPEASAPAPGADQAIQPAPSVEELQAEYAKLDPEALKMHYLACKSALMATMGADQGAPGGEASAPPPAAAPPPPAAGAPMAMGEMKAGKQLPSSPGNGGKLGKSEDVEKLEKQLAAQDEALMGLAKVVEKLTTPIRKSVKGVSDLKVIGKTDDGSKPSQAASLSKKEVTEKLKERVREGKLSKSDKDLVSKYTVGAVDLSKIEHLLVDSAAK